MNGIMAFGDSFFKVIPGIFMALLLLVLAWVAAGFAKKITIKVLEKLKLKKYADKLGLADETAECSLIFFGDLVFLIVLLLFVPGILNHLGMRNVSTPIYAFVTKIFDFVPNLIAAGIILVVGFFLARIISKLLMPVLKKLNVDKLQEKAGIEAADTTSLSSIITYLVYVLILFPVITAALQVLNISAISEPAVAMLEKVIMFLPNVIIAAVIVFIGFFIARLVGKLIADILSGFGINSMLRRLAGVDEKAEGGISCSRVIGKTVEYIIAFLFLVQAMNVLNLEVFQLVGEAILAYLPLALSALLIVALAIFFANWAEKVLSEKCGHGKACSLFVKALIMVFAFFLALGQLGIAPAIVNAAFIIILSAVSVAFAIAFGLGGKEFAANALKKMEECHAKKACTEKQDEPSSGEAVEPEEVDKEE